ncbi:LysE family translocator [Saccharothrix sp. 6-C]|uniref:Threonine/homoserine/homoserine lactone efflux protein n=1 Tax=Saccharothrix texasensis TaxID=103734 RepID=A0A3N1GZ60_9PSEU|nr:MULTISPECIES: LysE family translocator [Saccharothrix]QQQ79934.1 LysE family translocator [Saccharothrix sp. 6-C]ROP35517.1 threonine/homoserine/homoserine lactone efflux protein [Saccharothrix texasensis]
MTSGLLSYLGLCLLITVTPGLDTAVVVRNALRGGTRAGLWTAVGCAAGLFVHAFVVAIGLAGLLLRSQFAFDVVRWGGAVFLVLLGLRSLWVARRPVAPAPGPEQEGGRWGRHAPVVQGLMTNLTNPKATLFFLAALPQFVPVDESGRAVPVAVGLAVIAVLFSLAGLGLVAVGLGRARRWLDSPRARQAQEALLGATLVALGVRVALE